MPVVGWIGKMAPEGSKSKVQLHRELALSQNACKNPPLEIIHISGILNDLADMPPQAFGY